jgi:hypothetical protein
VDDASKVGGWAAEAELVALLRAWWTLRCLVKIDWSLDLLMKPRWMRRYSVTRSYQFWARYTVAEVGEAREQRR